MLGLEASPISAVLPNSTQTSLQNQAGDIFLVQIAWPLSWKSREGAGNAVPIIYILDGNAYFFSAVEAVRRACVLTTSTDAIVVGVGYPPNEWVYNVRRNYDLTPPSPHYVPPIDVKGKEYPAQHGGADQFLDFLVNDIRKHVKEGVLPNVETGEEILLGHSYGALFTLHALFKDISPFRTFAVLSPSIWWNDDFILSEEANWIKREATARDSTTNIFFCYGDYEQEIFKRPDWSDEEYQSHVTLARNRRMKDRTIEMAERLQKSNRFHSIKLKGYVEEDHGTVAICGLSWVISSILDPGRFK